MAKKPKRFEVIESETPEGGMLLGVSAVILRDTLTGVLYLLGAYGQAGGLTPLLGADGKPVVWKGEGELKSPWS